MLLVLFFTFILGFGCDLSFSCIFFAFLAFRNVILVAFHHLSYGFSMFFIFHYLYLLILQCNLHFTNMALQRQPSPVNVTWRDGGMASAIKVFQSLYKDQWIQQARLLGMYRFAGIDICRHRAAIYRVRAVIIEFTGLQLFSVFWLNLRITIVSHGVFRIFIRLPKYY